jgi:signal peptidase I
LAAETPAPVVKRGLSTGAIIGIVAGGLALVLVLVAVVVALFAIGNDTIRLKLPGVSMEPTIQAGQSVSATKVNPGAYRPQRGDIVVFTAPAGWIAGGDPGQMLIKRVIGLPGERLVCCDPDIRWTVNGTPLAEPYVKDGNTTAGMSVDVVVPDGRLWVLGDNRSASADSATHFSVSSDIGFATVPVSAVAAIVKP